MNRFLIILLGLLALAILGYFCIYKHWPEIQDDVNTRTHAALSEQGLDQVIISTNGRDIILAGEVATNAIKQQTEDHAINVDGVRTVDNQLTVAASEAEQEQESIIEPVEEVIQATEPKILPEYACQQEFDALLSSSQINFTTNSADIDSSSNELLSNLINVAKQCAEANIEIAGHTDSRGSADYNLSLSQARASSVMSYLISNSIETSRLSAVGYGETSPIADNDSEEGLAKNRRIEFNVEGLSE
jgi:outer membrane protein OmpA-like peptidoglycan-associated protein